MLGRGPGSMCAGEHENRAVSRDGDRLQFVNELVERLFVFRDAAGGYDAVETRMEAPRVVISRRTGQQPFEAIVVQDAQTV